MSTLLAEKNDFIVDLRRNAKDEEGIPPSEKWVAGTFPHAAKRTSLKSCWCFQKEE